MQVVREASMHGIRIGNMQGDDSNELVVTSLDS